MNELEKIIVVNPETFEKKVKAIEAAGHNSLHIIADFDMTLTQALVAGRRISSTWSALRLNGKYDEERQALLDYYLPIENDPVLDLKIKQVHMNTWWREHLELIVRHGVTIPLIKQRVAESNIVLRTKASELFEIANRNSLPFLVFSAGLGDLIIEFLGTQKLLSSNIHIISNFFRFDTTGNVIGFEEDIVHSFNKSEVQLTDKPYMKEIVSRRNVLLLGDTLGDADMVSGFSHDTVIKIGFLNGKHELLESYKKCFDVVILEDTDMGYVTTLLQLLLGEIKQ